MIEQVLTLVAIFALSFMIGLGRSGPRLVVDWYRHFPGNHPCDRVGCCR